MASGPDTHVPVEESDRWLLPVGDGVVTQLQIDFAFGFTVEQSLHFHIGEPYKDGRLVVRVADGRVLSVPAGEHYEAFEVTGSWTDREPFQFISLPGAGLAERVRGDGA